jgi:hypothetical protein
MIPPMPFFPPGAPMMIPPNVSIDFYTKKKFSVDYLVVNTTTWNEWRS